MPRSILGRPVYVPPQVPNEWNPVFVRNQLAAIARSFAPNLMRTVTADTILAATDEVILCDGTLNVTLLPPDQVQFLVVTIKQIQAAATATVLGTVDGAVNPTLAVRYAAMTIQSDGVAWWLLSSI